MVDKMAKAATTKEAFDVRIDKLHAFLKAEYPRIDIDQKHLDLGTLARGYWHYGYLMALRDVRDHLFPNSDNAAPPERAPTGSEGEQ